MAGSDMYQVQITAGVLEEKQDQSYSRLQVYQVPMCTRCRVKASRDVHQVCQIRGVGESYRTHFGNYELIDRRGVLEHARTI